VIPKAIENHKAYGYVFNGYWRDIGTIKSFYEANIELTRMKPKFDFLSLTERVFTRPRFLPPTKVVASSLNRTLMSEGCILEGADVDESVIGLRSIVRKGSVVKRTVVLGNDFYMHENPLASGGLGIGRNCRIQNCIIDKNVKIGDRVTITNPKRIREKDGDNYYIRGGIVIIPKGATILDRTVI